MLLLILLNILNDYADQYGEHYCEFSLQPNEYKKCYCVLRSIGSHLTFLKKSCSLGLARWFAIKLHNSNSFGQNINFVGLMCRGMKNISRNFPGKQTSTGNVIALAIICLSPHPAYSIK